eukprot:TRINITY_DN9654_c0_g1_i14.p1 TRINITY_DN9654_c0_g1~~TRINITY_DN9654_c0_g1_i14.p1  ORF type:complete len:145 (+),score=33.29 TRINITY_DN9654_c0_g1_i14:65-499(+)
MCIRDRADREPAFTLSPTNDSDFRSPPRLKEHEDFGSLIFSINEEDEQESKELLRERRINQWLQERGVWEADPSQKYDEFFFQKQINVQEKTKNSLSTVIVDVKPPESFSPNNSLPDFPRKLSLEGSSLLNRRRLSRVDSVAYS